MALAPSLRGAARHRRAAAAPARRYRRPPGCCRGREAGFAGPLLPRPTGTAAFRFNQRWIYFSSELNLAGITMKALAISFCFESCEIKDSQEMF